MSATVATARPRALFVRWHTQVTVPVAYSLTDLQCCSSKQLLVCLLQAHSTSNFFLYHTPSPPPTHTKGYASDTSLPLASINSPALSKGDHQCPHLGGPGDPHLEGLGDSHNLECRAHCTISRLGPALPRPLLDLLLLATSLPETGGSWRRQVEAYTQLHHPSVFCVWTCCIIPSDPLVD